MVGKVPILSLQEFKIRTLLYLLERIDKVDGFFRLFKKVKVDQVSNSSFGAYSQLLPESFLISTLIYYRSLFQSACFEKKKSSIDPVAYGYDEKDKAQHEILKYYVDKIIAHQDIEEGQKLREITDEVPRYLKGLKNIKYISTNSSGQQTTYSPGGKHTYSAKSETAFPINEEDFSKFIKKIKQELKSTITYHKEKTTGVYC